MKRAQGLLGEFNMISHESGDLSSCVMSDFLLLGGDWVYVNVRKWCKYVDLHNPLHFQTSRQFLLTCV